jgi:hypothetical protein
MRRALLPILGVLACLRPAGAVADEPPQGVIRAYLSAVDGSRQQYGVYLPRANPPSDAGYPIVMHAHGYGWWVGADLSLWQRQWADDHGWILVNVNGRGPNFYDGIGEDDVMRVLEDVGKLVAVDRSRVYMTGGSMGGTGAYRMGVRRPDVFSGAAPVDGWTDFREFHWHWYERKDMPNAIEEFRRPLLEAVSPLYTAGTARWGNVQLIVDGLDNIVYPQQGVDLSKALEAEKADAPEVYRHELVYNPDVGHCGGYDLRRIYERFLAVAGLERPPSVTIEATLLRYGKVHWAAIDRFGVQGAMGRLDVQVSESAAYVSLRNVEAFSLSLPDSPLAGRDRVQVVVDGVPSYDGPPTEVSLEFARDHPAGDASWQPADRPGLHKRRGLEGPIGEALLAPFTVAWGTAGASASVRQGQIEAEDFANEWNAFNVHYDAVRAKPEDELTQDEATTTNLIIFGTLDSSSILRRIGAACELPVQVHDDSVLVRDPANGDRLYQGAKYGAYWVYPNPLTGFRTLVVGCRGRFATKPDGSVRRGLGYDLEKLQWGWGDYVVFDSDLDDLPYVENVNNKPPVITYEAGYFAEAGFLDQDWRPDRAVELRRVLATRPEGSRLIHVDWVRPAGTGVEVRVANDRGEPVRQARVTLSWSADGGTFSRPTNDDGVALFAAPQRASAEAFEAKVVNVCATAGTYSWPDDHERKALLAPGDVNRIRVTASPERAETAVGGAVSFTVSIRNEGAAPAEVTISAADGVTPATQMLSVAAGRTGEARLVWDAGDLPAGDHPVPISVSARAGGRGQAVVQTTPVFTVRLEPPEKMMVVRVGAPDRRRSEPFEVTAEIENRDERHEVAVTASCVIVEAQRYLPTQEVRVPPRGKVTLRWQSAAGSRPLESGVYTATVSLSEVTGAAGSASFVVK